MSAILHDSAGHPVVVGSGVAGLVAALTFAPHPVLLVTSGSLGTRTSSALAQGGMAAAVGADDNADLHAADTLAAGDGLCDAAVVQSIVGAAKSVVALLQRFGVAFDRDATGAFSLGLEAAHVRNRILHVAGDGSGAAIVDALVRAVGATPSITVMDHADVVALQADNGVINGVVCVSDGKTIVIPSNRVLLATGGLGGLYNATTNPVGSFGQGIALAARVGAVLSDMEFVQFHPTALRSERCPLALVSEAVRGDGAVLLDENGRRMMRGVHGEDLAPRDIVARAVAAEIDGGRSVYLDARVALGAGFPQRFPTVDSFCREAGVDPCRELIPVMPAAHYHMGGIDVDRRGRSSVAGLWAAGEVASTGLHGANRLASNSLLEAAVMGMRAAEDMAAFAPVRKTAAPSVTMVSPQSLEIDSVRHIVSAHLGVLRNGDGLRRAVSDLLTRIEPARPTTQPAAVALLIAVFALLRTETRGSHARTDYTQHLEKTSRRKMTLAEAVNTARLSISTPDLRRA